MTARRTQDPEELVPKADIPNGRHPVFRRSCPVCERYFSWLERWRFTDWLGRRNEVPCPRCETVLMWSKYPRMVISHASWVFMVVNVFLLFIFAADWSFEGRFDITLALQLVALILAMVMFAALRWLRLIKAPEPQ